MWWMKHDDFGMGDMFAELVEYFVRFSGPDRCLGTIGEGWWLGCVFQVFIMSR